MTDKVTMEAKIPDTCSECVDPCSKLCEHSKQCSDFWATQYRKKLRRPVWCKYRDKKAEEARLRGCWRPAGI